MIGLLRQRKRDRGALLLGLLAPAQRFSYCVHGRADVLRVVATAREERVQPATAHDRLELPQRDELLPRRLLNDVALVHLFFLENRGDGGVGHIPGDSLPREILLHEVWGYNPAVTTHTLETHIYRLRRKIEENPGEARILVTEERGYRLSC